MDNDMFQTQSIKLKAEDLNGVYAELAELLGLDAVQKLFCRYRGTQISFPVRLFSSTHIRDSIRRKYNGSNIRSLAMEYGYTERWIRKLLRTEDTVG